MANSTLESPQTRLLLHLAIAATRPAPLLLAKLSAGEIADFLRLVEDPKIEETCRLLRKEHKRLIAGVDTRGPQGEPLTGAQLVSRLRGEPLQGRLERLEAERAARIAAHIRRLTEELETVVTVVRFLHDPETSELWQHATPKMATFVRAAVNGGAELRGWIQEHQEEEERERRQRHDEAEEERLELERRRQTLFRRYQALMELATKAEAEAEALKWETAFDGGDWGDGGPLNQERNALLKRQRARVEDLRRTAAEYRAEADRALQGSYRVK